MTSSHRLQLLSEELGLEKGVQTLRSVLFPPKLTKDRGRVSLRTATLIIEKFQILLHPRHIFHGHKLH
jgi:hypothetical protein